MKFTKLILENQKRTTLLYHGTSSVFLKSILKNGLMPAPPEKSWGNPDIMGSAYESFYGVYFAKYPSLASNVAKLVASRRGGSPIVITIQYVQGSGTVDEDIVTSSIIHVIKYFGIGVRKNFNEKLSYVVDSIQKGNDNVALTTQSLSNLKDLFKVAINIIGDNKKNIEQLNLDNYGIILEDSKFRKYLLKFINSTKVFSDSAPGLHNHSVSTPGPTQTFTDKSIRITRPVGFSGKTRIIQIHDLDTGEIYYSSPD